MIKTSISMKEAPSREVLHRFLNGVFPPGFYRGGLVTPGAGRQINVSSFNARSFEGLNIYTDSQEVLNNLPQPSSRTSFLLVLYCKLWTPTSPNDDHKVEFRFIQESNWSSYVDQAYCIILSRVWLDSPGAQPVILSTDIDSTVGQVINLQYQSGKTFLSGTSPFNGQVGTVITHNLATSNYRVSITPNGVPTDGIGIGDIWYVKNPNNLSFTVYCTGNGLIENFDWILTTAPSSL